MLLHGRDLEENTRESCESINSLVLKSEKRCLGDGNYEDLALHILGTHIFFVALAYQTTPETGAVFTVTLCNVHGARDIDVCVIVSLRFVVWRTDSIKVLWKELNFNCKMTSFQSPSEY